MFSEKYFKKLFAIWIFKFFLVFTKIYTRNVMPCRAKKTIRKSQGVAQMPIKIWFVFQIPFEFLHRQIAHVPNFQKNIVKIEIWILFVFYHFACDNL